MAKKKKITVKNTKVKRNKRKKTKLINDDREQLKLIENEKDTMQEKIEELMKENAELKNSLLRKAADFENAKKIFQKENEKKKEKEIFNIFGELIDIIDNFDRALEHLETNNDENQILEGIKMIDKHFHNYLEKFNVKRFSSKGEKFDPSIHEAISVITDNTAEDGEIVEEIAKGYKINDKILRHAKVIVNQKNEINENEIND